VRSRDGPNNLLGPCEEKQQLIHLVFF